MEETIKKTAEALAAFSEALAISPAVYTWHYSTDGKLLETNCPETVYHRIFEHTGCFAYMLGEGISEHSPLILGAAFGILWCAVYAQREEKCESCYVIGPVFYSEVYNDLLEDAIRRYHIDPAWRPVFAKAMHGIPVTSSRGRIVSSTVMVLETTSTFRQIPVTVLQIPPVPYASLFTSVQGEK